MKVLAVDTSTRVGTVGICDDGELLGEISFRSRESHSSRVLPTIDLLLKTLGLTLNDIDAFGVTLGPGSFTGLRVGLSTVKALAWSSGKPMVGLNSLELLATQAGPQEFDLCPMLDAHRDRVWGAIYRCSMGELTERIAPCDTEPLALVRSSKGPIVCFGDGSRKYRNVLEQATDIQIHWAPPEWDYPRGSIAARRAFQALTLGQQIPTTSAEPIYLREFNA